jgi:hypothetical protein
MRNLMIKYIIKINTINQLIKITTFKILLGLPSPFSVKIAKAPTKDRKINNIIDTKTDRK